MAASEELLEHVLDLLGDGPVETKKEWGGYALKRDGVGFAMLYDDLYLRVDDETRPAYEAAGSEPFTYTAAGRQVRMRRYYRAPDGALDDGSRLAELVDEALAAARRDPPKPRRKKKPA